ncbi:hypothetical protein N018_14195 [Pseudomonas syringae CC1557]|uniref:Uncharacterized protein n=1 Tax=Pseudomonas syringae CC1557 TaxID=1357279 RepID=W0MYW6_PSESX|nr:hypothetical protein N018_14195 [Pseudomonas syringae CC1557]
MRKRESERFGVKGFITDVDEKKALGCSARAQDLHFSSAEWTLSVKIKRQWPLGFLVHG